MTGDNGTACDVTVVRSGERQIGAYVKVPDRMRFVPAVDVTALALGSMAVVVGTPAAGPPADGLMTFGPARPARVGRG